MLPMTAVALAFAALASACGSDRAEVAQFERLRTACAGLVGATLGQATAAMGTAPFEALSCRSDLGAVGASDVCPGAPGVYTAPVCQLDYEYCARGTSICAGGALGGCAYACEIRVAAASMVEIGAASVICATRFISGQPAGPISRYPCR